MNKDDPRTTQTVVTDIETSTEVFTAEEERILRMRAGAGLPPEAPLGNKLERVPEGVRDDVVARLRLIEAELLEALRETDDDPDPEAAPAPEAAVVEDAPAPARKSRIVAALRDKPRD